MEHNETALQLQQTAESVPAVADSVWTNKEQFDQIARSANMLAKTTIIPQNYQGKPADCFIAIEMASRMGISPMMVMQNMYTVKGKPAWSGQACITLINSCGKFRNVKCVYTGEKGTENRGCYFSATRISDGETVDGTEITMIMAKAEGWTANSKWRNMPEQMLAYRAAAFFARIHCPEALMGAQTVDEVEDINQPKTASLNELFRNQESGG